MSVYLVPLLEDLGKDTLGVFLSVKWNQRFELLEEHLQIAIA